MGVDPAIDITAEQRKIILTLLNRHLPGTAAWVYGSRAKWTSRPQSDLDLVVFAAPDQRVRVGALRDALEESDLPFRVDLFVWDDIPEAFLEQIERDHVTLLDGGENFPNEEQSSGPNEWGETSLGDLIDISHGFAFKGEYIFDEPQGDVLLTPENFAIGGGFKPDKLKYYSGPVSEEYVLLEGDLIVSMTDLSKQSDTLGFPAVVPKNQDGRRYLHNQRLGKIHVTDPDLEIKYIYYVMCGNEYRHEVLASATGTTVKHTSPHRIRQFRFWIASPSEQRAIAHVLGTLDDKIELNRRMNETLEAMARALFKSWFVDFDPVRAKMEGRDPGLPKPLADLFPDRLVDSELGKIPEGWGVKGLGDLLVLAYGKALKADSRRHDGDVPVYGSNGQVGWHDEALVRGPGIVVGRKGNPGVVTWVNSNFYCIDTTFYVIAKESYDSLHFLYHVLAKQDLPSIAADSAVPGLNRNLAYMNKQVVPVGEIVEYFDICVSPMFSEGARLMAESQTLISLRDALLPKLISGDIRLRNAENMVGAVA